MPNAATDSFGAVAVNSAAAAAHQAAVDAAPKALTLDQIKNERRASSGDGEGAGAGAAKTKDDKGAVGASAGAGGAAGDGEGAGKKKTVKVDIPDKEITRFVKLNTDLRDARKKITELEPVAAQGAKVAKAIKLIAEGKNFDAIREVVGDAVFNAAVKEVIGGEGEGAPKVDPALKKLQDEVDELKGKTKGTEEQLTAAAAAQREVGITKIYDEIKTDLKDRFPFLSRSEKWTREALGGAEKAYDAAKTHHGRDLTDPEKQSLIRAALEVAEEDHAANAKLYGVEPAKPKTPPTGAAAAASRKKIVDNARAASGGKKPTPRTVDNAMRGNVTQLHEKKKSATLEELKRERRQRG